MLLCFVTVFHTIAYYCFIFPVLSPWGLLNTSFTSAFNGDDEVDMGDILLHNITRQQWVWRRIRRIS